MAQGLGPGLRGWFAADEAARQQNSSQLQQMGGLLQLRGILQQQQEQQELKGVISQAGGDPSKAIQALLSAGTPKSMEMAAKLQNAFQKPQGQPIGAGGLYMPDKTVIPPAARPPVAPEMTRLEKYMKLRESMPAGDPRIPILDNAIEKESKTAKQISPTVVIPRPEQPLVSIVGDDGEPKLVRREDAVGRVPWSGATAGKKEKLESARDDVDKTVAQLKTYYDQLNSTGGIVNYERGSLSNIGARIASSSIGQVAGGAVGTKNQNVRDSISQQRPLLLRSIMQATGMSAKQLDSNAELKLWLATATDPEKGYQANLSALDNISEMFGRGGFLPKSENKPIGRPSAGPAIPPPPPGFTVIGGGR